MARSKMRNQHYDLNSEEALAALVAHNGGPEELMIQEESSKQLLCAIQQMGEPDGEIFFRYFFRDEKLRQIAEALSMKLPTVKSRFGRGKKKLKDLLIEMGVGYEG